MNEWNGNTDVKIQNASLIFLLYVITFTMMAANIYISFPYIKHLKTFLKDEFGGM